MLCPGTTLSPRNYIHQLFVYVANYVLIGNRIAALCSQAMFYGGGNIHKAQNIDTRVLHLKSCVWLDVGHKSTLAKLENDSGFG